MSSGLRPIATPDSSHVTTGASRSKHRRPPAARPQAVLDVAERRGQ